MYILNIYNDLIEIHYEYIYVYIYMMKTNRWDNLYFEKLTYHTQDRGLYSNNNHQKINRGLKVGSVYMWPNNKSA